MNTQTKPIFNRWTLRYSNIIYTILFQFSVSCATDIFEVKKCVSRLDIKLNDCQTGKQK